MIRLYNILAQYELPIGESPIEYMVSRGILMGTDNGLGLDQVCTTEQAVLFAIRLIQDTYTQLEAGAKGFAWKVENDGKTIYFLGSIHLANSDVYPINAELMEAFTESDALIVEANIFNKQEGMDYFLEKAMYQDGTTLKDNISEETYEKVAMVLESYGIPEEQYNYFKPWYIANNLSVLSSTNSNDIEEGQEAANLGVDMYFLTKATLMQKPILELEGIEYQADLFDSLSEEVQEEYLITALDSILEPESEKVEEAEELLDTGEIIDDAELLNLWLNQWKEGDIEGFASSYNEVYSITEDEFSSMLFGERDKNMTEQIIELLELENDFTVFVVVGSGHLVLPDTIIDQLLEHGYDVKVFY